MAVEQIATYLMFVGDQSGRAEEAMNLYVSLFGGSEVLEIERFGRDEEESGVKHARFRLAGRDFIAMDGGRAHAFTFTPATSLFVECDDEARLDNAFAELSRDGSVLMPLQAYPFSPRFAWLNDRYGVSWQLSLLAG
jgi:predicted 3-demethylubiquinone-9 3-methyltransferase (glyoxalase superfamily)